MAQDRQSTEGDLVLLTMARENVGWRPVDDVAQGLFELTSLRSPRTVLDSFADEH